MNQKMTRTSYQQITSLRNRIKTYKEQLYKSHPDRPAEPSFLYGFSLNFPELQRQWKGLMMNHSDMYRVHRLLQNLCRVKAIVLHCDPENHEEISKAYLLLEEVCDHLALLLLNQMVREDWKCPPPELYQLCQAEDVSSLKALFRKISRSVSRFHSLILDSVCKIQEEFEEEYPELFEYIWNHHIPVTEEQGQEVLDGVVDQEELLEEVKTFYHGEYVKEFLEEGEEDDFEAVLFASGFDFDSLLEELG